MARSESRTRGASRRRATPDLLRNLRHLRVVVFHPRDTDGEILIRHLQRIGCQVISLWPPVLDLPETVDVIFAAVRPEFPPPAGERTGLERSPAIIAVIDYENPTIVDAVLTMGATAVLASPIRSAGILASLALAISLNDEVREAHKRINRLEQKLQSTHQISDAKLILMRTRNVSDTEAYRLIRDQAMSERVATEEIARAIIRANAVLGPS